MKILAASFAFGLFAVNAAAQVFIVPQTNVIEGQPVTLTMEIPVPCTCAPITPVVAASDVVTWTFGDGSADVAVTGSIRVTHAFPRGVFNVQARLNSAAFASGEIFAPANPATYVDVITPQNAKESDGTLTLQFIRSGDMSVTTAVTVRTSPNVPLFGAVEPKTVVITFSPGETAKQVPFTLPNNSVYDGVRFPSFEMFTKDGAFIRSPFHTWWSESLSVRLEDDEAPPFVSIGDLMVTEGSNGTTEAVVPITLSSPLGREWSLPVLTNWPQRPNQTAKYGEDFTSTSLVVFPKGVTRMDVRVTIIGDKKPEADEQFTLDVDNYNAFAMPLVMVKPTATCTILNDDYALDPPFQRLAAGAHQELLFDIGNPVSAPSTVEIFVSGGAVTVPTPVLMPAGSATVKVPFDAVQTGTSYVQARLVTAHGVATAEARVDVVESTTLRADPESLTLHAGDTATLRLSFAPPVAEPHAIILAWSGTAAVEIPSMVVVPAGGSVAVPVRALTRGAGAITASAPDLLAATTVLLDVVNPEAPVIDTVTPPFGSSGTRVTIKGSQFSEQCSVTFGDLLATVEARSATSLTAVAPPHAAGAVDVTVTCGAATAMKTRAFTYTASRRRASR